MDGNGIFNSDWRSRDDKFVDMSCNLDLFYSENLNLNFDEFLPDLEKNNFIPENLERIANFVQVNNPCQIN